ncbi:MAG: hypothetical protein WB852_02865, partial [Thermoplasmata archaeon]
WATAAGGPPAEPSHESSAAPSAASTASPQAAPRCPTPQSLPDWTSSEFFDDVLVSFAVPGYANLSGAEFQTVPCLNALPTYLPGFWMNLSTDVPIQQAYVNIWGTLWPTPDQPLADLPGFPYDSTGVTQFPMFITPGAPEEASFYFNTHRFFYPGSTVYFNVTVKSPVATPSTINSATELSGPLPKGSNLNATWQFTLDSPWWSPDFHSDIRVSTTPPVVGGGALLAPNENQSLLVTIESLGPSGAAGVPIPQAQLALTISNDPGFDGTYGIPFGVANHTWQNLTTRIGPYPNATIEFSVSASMLWEGGVIDKITGPTNWFNWSTGGGWQTPSLGLAANAVIATDPSVLSSATATLPSGTSVNVSLQEPIENVTISSSILRFHYSDSDGSVSGLVPMHLIRQNASYVVLPGFPSGGHLTFSLLAKDVFGDPLASGNYSYLELGPATTNLTPSFSYFYVEGINATTGDLITGAPFTVSNASWSQSAVTTPFGFGLLLIPNGAGTLELPYGTYTVSMTAVGHSQTTKVSLGSPTPVTVRFWFAHGPVTATSVIPLSPLSVGLIAGVVALTLAVVPLLRWFQERQKKAEKERTRITL